MSSVTPDSSAGEDTVFIEARDAFLNSLQPRERKLFTKCSSAEQLITDIEEHKAFSRKRPLLRRSAAGLKALNESLSPFFAAIGFFTQSHPEVAAIVWGAIRLALQLASNFNSFFEKLTLTLHRLTEEFPQYGAVVSLFKNKELPSRLKQSLCSVYTDLLRFLQSVVGIFTRNDGTTRRSYAIFADICWRPYDLRFKDLLDDLHFHGELVKSEIHFATYHELREMHQSVAGNREEISGTQEKISSLEERLKEARKVAYETLQIVEELKVKISNRLSAENHPKTDIMDDLKKWFETPNFALDFERAVDIREEGTAEWLFEEPEFMAWKNFVTSNNTTVNETIPDNSLRERFLLIQGNPGCGKTILAAATIEELSSSNPTQNTCYFFFRDHTPEFESPIQAYRSILAQTLKKHEHDEVLVDKFIFLMTKEDSNGQTQATRRELLDILRICAQCESIQNIVLDGIDECNNSTQLLSDLSEVLGRTSVKVILFSRPHISIPLGLSSAHQLPIGKSTSKDIEAYLSRKLQSMVAQNLLPSDVDAKTLLDPLLTGADGMFLWAHLMVNYLCSRGLTRTKRLKEIRSITLPEGLDAMYDRILYLISQWSRPDRDLAKWIFMWLTFSCRRLTAAELEATLHVRTTDIDDNDVDFTDFNSTVISTCASLVERGQIHDAKFWTHVPCYRFIHLSAYEYFEARLRGRGRFFLLSASESHLTMARGSLQYISLAVAHLLPMRERCVGPNPAKGELITPDCLGEIFPLLDYAMTYWAQHLKLHRKNMLNIFCANSTLGQEIFGSKDSLWAILQAQRTQRPDEYSVSFMQLFSELVSAISRIVSKKTNLMVYIEISYLLATARRTDLEALQCWLKWVTPECGLAHMEEERLNTVLHDAEEMGRYLLLLDDQWGSKLHERPELIWDEVTAFTPSRLLHETMGTRVYSLFSNHFNSQKVGSKYLCKVSETSKDQKYVGILSIWPSREYEQLSRSFIDQNFLMDCIYKSSFNWFARYEIWSSTSTPARLSTSLIALESENIWEQYRRSLSTGYFPEGFRLQFPLSISSCLHKFTILETVYFVHANRLTEAKITALPLPFSLNTIYSGWWGQRYTHRETIQAESFESWRDNNRRSTYSLVFDQCGRRILFTGTVIPGSIIHFAVFDVGDALGPSISFAGPLIKLPIKGYAQWSPEHHQQVFHPEYDLVALTAPHIPSGWACLWAYRGKNIDTSEPLILETYPLESVDPNARFWYRSQDITNMNVQDGKMVFSEDGKHLILHQGRRGHSVIRIPQHVFNACKGTENADSFDLQDAALTSAHLSNSGPAKKAVTNIYNSLIRSAAYNIGADGTMTGISTNTSNGSIKMTLWAQKQTSKSSADVEITALPNSWNNLRNVTPSLQLPKSKDENIRIVLNKAAEPWYDMSKNGREEGEECLPAIIDRDVQHIRMLGVRGIEGNGASALLSIEEDLGAKETAEYGDWDVQEEGSEGRPSKKIRRE